MKLLALDDQPSVMFSRFSDEYETADDFFAVTDEEFGFVLDAAASATNKKCKKYLGLDHPVTACRDALAISWFFLVGKGPVWLNPPYSKCGPFVAKAAEEAKLGVATTMLIAARTDTRYWHKYIWDRKNHRPRPGVEVRFLKGRLKFKLHITNMMRKQVMKLAPDYTEKQISKKIKLPVTSVRSILDGTHNIKSSAPFPSALVIFRKPLTRSGRLVG
jgi:phage N-6-adenine-methyltransferase